MSSLITKSSEAPSKIKKSEAEAINASRRGFPSRLALFTKLSKFEGQLKAKKQEARIGGKAPQELVNIKIDKNLVKHYESLLLKEHHEICSYAARFQNESSKQKPKRMQRLKQNNIPPLSCPYYVTDNCVDFFKKVNLGNSCAKDYLSKRFYDEMFLDGRDRSTIEKVVSKKCPGISSDELRETVNNHDIHRTLAPFMFDENIFNSNALSNLFALYSYANKLYSEKKIRVHPSDEFMRGIFDQKVRFSVAGKDLLEGVDLDRYDSHMREILKKGTEIETELSAHEILYRKWLKADANPPKSKNAKGTKLHGEHTELELSTKYTELYDSLESVKKDAADLLFKIFGEGNLNSPLSLIKKLLNRNKTFGEILREYPENKNHGKAYVRKGDEKEGTDLYGYTSTMHNVFKSYMLVPPFLVETRMGERGMQKLKSDEMKSNIAGMEVFVKEIVTAYKEQF